MDEPHSIDQTAENSAEVNGQSSTDQAPQWQSDQLLQGRREVLIKHDGECYRLRLTRNGKLILHK